MIDDEQRRHWSDLAEQLGLPPDTSEDNVHSRMASPPTPPAREPRPSATPVSERESFSSVSEEVDLPDSVSDEAEPMSPSAATETSGAGSHEEAEPSTEHRQRRGRRGGRRRDQEFERGSGRGRGSRGRRPRAEAEAETPPEAAGQSEQHPVEDEKRNRRRRPSERTEPAVPDGERAPEAAAGEAEAPETEDDREEIDTLSDWNVPSWAELIASLYRPER